MSTQTLKRGPAPSESAYWSRLRPAYMYADDQRMYGIRTAADAAPGKRSGRPGIACSNHPVGDGTAASKITETAESQKGLGTGRRVDGVQLLRVVLRDLAIDEEVRPVVVPTLSLSRGTPRRPCSLEAVECIQDVTGVEVVGPGSTVGDRVGPRAVVSLVARHVRRGLRRRLEVRVVAGDRIDLRAQSRALHRRVQNPLVIGRVVAPAEGPVFAGPRQIVENESRRALAEANASSASSRR